MAADADTSPDPSLEALKRAASRILQSHIERHGRETSVSGNDFARLADELVRAARQYGHHHTPQAVTVRGNIQIVMIDGEHAPSFAIGAPPHG